MKRVLLGIAAALALSGTAEARIARSSSVVAQFKRANPCPVTGKTSGACGGYVVDHKWPLCALGPDEVWNMAWQTRAESLKKDKVEKAKCTLLRQKGVKP